MSKARGLVPLTLAITFGILNGVATFGPAFKDQEREKLQREQKESGGSEGVGLAEAKAVGDGEMVKGADAPTGERSKGAKSGGSSWSVFKWPKGGDSASTEDDQVRLDPRTRGDGQVQNSTAGLAEAKAVGDGEMVKGADAPTGERSEVAASWSVFKWPKVGKSASTEDDQVRSDPRTRGEGQAQGSTSTDS